jgi:ABC-type enterochelin transport system ATPase subunit
MKDGRFVQNGRKDVVLTDQHIGNLFEVPVRVRKAGGYYYAMEE